MIHRVRRAWAGILLCAVIVVWPAAVIAEDSLSSARDLYAAAAYEDALAALDRLRAGGMKVDENRAVDRTRAFCLLALGKSTEAAQAIEAGRVGRPSYHPSDSDVSPRVRAAFSDVRRRLLPDLAQQKYAYAKAAFDRKEYRVASDNFGQLLELFADPDLAPAASRPPLTDLRMLTVGFPRSPACRRSRRRPLLSHRHRRRPLWPWRRRRPPRLPPRPDPSRIYASSDANVVPPATVRQELPPFGGTMFKPDPWASSKSLSTNPDESRRRI